MPDRARRRGRSRRPAERLELARRRRRAGRGSARAAARTAPSDGTSGTPCTQRSTSRVPSQPGAPVTMSERSSAQRELARKCMRVAARERHHAALRVHAGRVGQHAGVVDVEVLEAAHLAERVGRAAIATLADRARRERVDGGEAERVRRQALVEPADRPRLSCGSAGMPPTARDGPRSRPRRGAASRGARARAQRLREVLVGELVAEIVAVVAEARRAHRPAARARAPRRSTPPCSRTSPCSSRSGSQLSLERHRRVTGREERAARSRCPARTPSPGGAAGRCRARRCARESARPPSASGGCGACRRRGSLMPLRRSSAGVSVGPPQTNTCSASMRTSSRAPSSRSQLDEHAGDARCRCLQQQLHAATGRATRAPASSAVREDGALMPCLCARWRSRSRTCCALWQRGAARGTSCAAQPIASMPRAKTSVLFGHGLPRSADAELLLGPREVRRQISSATRRRRSNCACQRSEHLARRPVPEAAVDLGAAADAAALDVADWDAPDDRRHPARR